MSQNEVYGRYTKPVFGADVVYAADPKKRNQQMQHMAYGLRTARLKSYVPMIEKETRAFLKSWGDSVRIFRRSRFSVAILINGRKHGWFGHFFCVSTMDGGGRGVFLPVFFCGVGGTRLLLDASDGGGMLRTAKLARNVPGMSRKS